MYDTIILKIYNISLTLQKEQIRDFKKSMPLDIRFKVIILKTQHFKKNTEKK